MWPPKSGESKKPFGKETFRQQAGASMELDELKEKWEEYDRKLEVNLRLNRRLLRDSYTARARFALWRLAGILALGSIPTLAVIVALGRFIAANWYAPR